MYENALGQLPMRPLYFFRKSLQSLENPTYLSKRWPWLYWKIYEFSWDRFYWIFNNNLAKVSILASAAGYLLFLNDILLENFEFTVITDNGSSVLGLSTRSKLALIYFGLILIALGRLIYLWRRPHSIKLGPSLCQWVNFGLREFTYSAFLGLHHEIRQNQHRTLYGKYYDDDWDAFTEDATWRESGRTHDLKPDEKRQSREAVNFSAAKQRHEDVLRSLLMDRYYEKAAKNKIGLLFALMFALPGYAIFLIPNIDLFLTISASFITVVGP